MNTIITLTTDYGIKDYFVSAIKGKLFSLIGDCNIVDITHSIECFNISQTSYIVEAAYKNFPKGTIHIIGVEHELSQNNKPLVIFSNGHYFISADNGILSFLVKNKTPDKIIFIDLDENKHSMDIFIETAAKIAKNIPLESIGESTETIKELSELKAVFYEEKNTISGNVIYEDNFGNSVSNITKEIFESAKKGRGFKIIVKNKEIKKINKYFSDFNVTDPKALKTREGELLAIFNELGYLQISLYRSNPNTFGCPRTLLGLEYRDTIKIEFIN